MIKIMATQKVDKNESLYKYIHEEASSAIIYINLHIFRSYMYAVEYV